MWATPALAAFEVPLTVTEPMNVARHASPVTSGIPLPPGQPLAGPWALFDGSKEIPVQVTPMGGHAPWILLDFQLDINARQAKVLRLVRQAPSVPRPVIVRKPPVTALQVVAATSGQRWIGIVERQTWEHEGPLRAVLRVDGRYGNMPGLGYTTRYTFYAGKRAVRIDHVLRNSLRPNERHLKLRSATLSLGGGVGTVRVPSFGIPVVVFAGNTVEVLPVQQPGVRNPTTRAPIPVDQNGGYVLPDLSHYKAVVIYDPAREWTTAAPLMALAPARWYAEHGHLTADRFGSLDDERATYQSWGWHWTTKQEPVAPAPTGTVTVARIDVHGDTEADDLWQNLLMFVRTRRYEYFARAREWAAYHTNEYPYRTDSFSYAWDGAGEANPVARPLLAIPLTVADGAFVKAVRAGRVDVRAWGADHFYGWGLLDWFMLTGDLGAVEAALDLGEISRRIHGPRLPHQKWVGGGRGLARHLLLSVRLWEITKDAAWKAHADHLVDLILGSPGWQESWGIYAFGTPLTVPAPFHIGLLHHALARYNTRFPQSEVRRRLILMADFARHYARHPVWRHAARSLILDSPSRGQVRYASLQEQWSNTVEPIVNPGHTIAWTDVLVRGFRLTGDRTFLDSAAVHWAIGSKTPFMTPATTRIAGPNEVLRFVNGRVAYPPHYFILNGDLPYVHLLFWDTARLTPRAPAG
jgi:hypothetical protein